MATVLLMPRVGKLSFELLANITKATYQAEFRGVGDGGLRRIN